ncbi:MAG: VanZ family protein [Proteobacteria bacterium]|nr:VanZ family protein [Pseudomonadota bacterium]
MLIFTGLWPFTFFPENRVTVDSLKGLHLTPPATLYTEAPPEKLSQLREFTFLLRLSSNFSGESGYARILSYSINYSSMNFMLAQWKDRLICRIKTDSNENTIHFEVLEFFKKGTENRLAVVFKNNEFNVYRDGERKKAISLDPMKVFKWNHSYPLVLGSDADGKFCWGGNIYSLSIYDRALSAAEVLEPPVKQPEKLPLIHYSFREIKNSKILDEGKGPPANLTVPRYYIPYKRPFFNIFPTDRVNLRYNLLDIVINILSFMPIGLLISIYLYSKKMAFKIHLLVSFLVGLSVSLLIEFFQAFIPVRDSTMNDVFGNVVGASFGAIIYFFLHVRRIFQQGIIKERTGTRNWQASGISQKSMHFIASIDNRHILFLTLLLISITIIYTPYRTLLGTYMTIDSYIHIIFVPIVCGYLFYEKKEAIFRQFSYDVKIGVPIATAGIGILLIGNKYGRHLNINDYTSIIMLSDAVFWSGSCIILYGLKAFRAALIPLLFLVFLIPIPTLVQNKVATIIQSILSNITSLVFKAINLPFINNGSVFYLQDNLNLDIAYCASRIPLIFALFILAFLVSHIFLATGWKKLVLTFSILPVVLLSNCVNILVLALLGVYMDDRILSLELSSTSMGLFFYIPVLVLFLPILWIFRMSDK